MRLLDLTIGLLLIGIGAAVVLILAGKPQTPLGTIAWAFGIGGSLGLMAAAGRKLAAIYASSRR